MGPQNPFSPWGEVAERDEGCLPKVRWSDEIFFAIDFTNNKKHAIMHLSHKFNTTVWVFSAYGGIPSFLARAKQALHR